MCASRDAQVGSGAREHGANRQRGAPEVGEVEPIVELDGDRHVVVRRDRIFGFRRR